MREELGEEPERVEGEEETSFRLYCMIALSVFNEREKIKYNRFMDVNPSTKA